MQMNKKTDNGYGVKKATAVNSYRDMLAISVKHDKMT